MEVFYHIVALLGGLALFLYGMRIMGDGLKSSSGGAMKAALAKVTNKPVMGFLLGAVVTCMIQSSTATIVLTVGLVGAGFLTFRQSIGIVLGANVGTAITAQIIRLMDVQAGATSILYFFKSDNLAPMALLIGIILIMFVKKKAAGTIGTIFMGFGILFVGLMNMSSAVSTMSGSLSRLLTSFEDNYFLGFLSGVAVTGVIQSSSAVVGILQSIASSVGVSFCGVFAVIIGVNIGDCLTTFLVCRIGARTEQIRTCLIHIIYNVFAAALLFIGIAVLRATGVLGDEFWYSQLNSGGVANVHGLFRLVPAVLLLPFSGVFADIAEMLVPDKEVDEMDADIEKNLRELDMRLISNPALALAESEHLIGHMADVCFHNFKSASKQVFDYKDKRASKIHDRENLLDRMADATSQYLVAISPNIRLEQHRRNQNFQLRALVCFERIGDLAVNIQGDVASLNEQDKHFSEIGSQEIRLAFSAVKDILTLSTEAFNTGSTILARKVEPLEEVIDELMEELRSRHVLRMTNNQCDTMCGISYQNILQHLERISDQCSDLAVYMLGRSDSSIFGKEHQYIHNLHHSNNQEYLEEFNADYRRYFDQLAAVRAGASSTDGDAPDKQTAENDFSSPSSSILPPAK